MFFFGVFFAAVLILVLVLKLVALFLSETSFLQREELSSYECGFEPHGLSRIPFSFRYFLLTLLFLLFDLEILLLLGTVVQFSFSSTCLLSGFLCQSFILFLFFGWLYEYLIGSLEWSSSVSF